MSQDLSAHSVSPSTQRWVLLLVGLAVLSLGFAAWRPTPAGVWHDDGVYLMVGQSLAEGGGLSYGGVVGTPPAPKFPPLYSGLMALLWIVFGDVGGVTLAAEILNLVFLAGAGALLSLTLMRHLGLHPGVAAIAGVLAFASGDVLRHALIPLSESLFVLLAMGLLACWPRGSDRPGAESAEASSGRSHAAPGSDGDETSGAPSQARDPIWPAALLLVLLVLTRSAGVAFVAGGGLALMLTGRWRTALAATGPSVIVMGLWSLWTRRASSGIPEGLSDVLGSYTGWLGDQLFGAPALFFARIPGHSSAVLERVAVLAIPRGSGWALWIGALLLLPVLALGVKRVARVHPIIVWSALAYLGLLLLWPYADRRLVVPLHPLVVALLAVGGAEAVRENSTTLGRRAVLVLAIGWAGMYSIVSASRIAQGWPVSAFEIRAERLATAVEAMRATVEPDAIVGAPELWPALHLHGGWTVTPSALFRPAATDASVPVWGSPQDQIDLWRSVQLDYLLLEQGGQIHGEALDSLQARCPGAANVVASFPPQMLIQLGWERCR